MQGYLKARMHMVKGPPDCTAMNCLAKSSLSSRFFDVPDIVWGDGSSCQRKDGNCKFGYALRGPTPVCERILVCGKHIPLLLSWM